jgi:hypothetical protein
VKPNLDLYHTPTRGSDVEDWLKRQREQYQRNQQGKPWVALDDLLDDNLEQAEE